MSYQISTNDKVQAEDYHGFGQQRIVELSNGILYACQINDSLEQDEISVFKSEDDGETWLIDKTFGIESGEEVIDPVGLSMCVSELDDVYLAYTDNKKYLVVKRKHRTTGEWSEILREEDECHVTTRYTRCLITYNRCYNRLHIFWARDRATAPDTNFKNRYSDDYGETWGAIKGHLSETSYVGTPVSSGLATDVINGDIYACLDYMSWAGAYSFSGRSYRFDKDGNYISIVRTPGACTQQYGICVDSNQNVWSIDGRRRSGYADRLRIYKGGSLSLTITFDAENDWRWGEACIACDNDDNIYIFYTKATNNACYYRKYTASTETWGAETLFSVPAESGEETAEGLRPSCIVNPISNASKLRALYTSGGLKV